MTKKFYDTNAILNNYDKLFENSERFVLSSQTLIELENIKTSSRKDESIKYKARKACRILDENIDKYDVSIDSEVDLNLSQTPDNIIMTGAYRWNKNVEPIVFSTNDVVCRIIANKIYGLDVESVCEEDLDNYTGFKEVMLSENDMAYFYQHLDENIYECSINEYLVIKDLNNAVVDKRKWNGEKYITLKINKFKDFKPLNIQQELAFDLMGSDTPIKILLGNSGSGKTLINLKFALNSVQKGKTNKILYLREMVGKGTPIGYLKGTKMEKMMPFLAGVVDNLNMGEFELQKMISEGTLEVDTPYFLKGASKENTWFLVDEAEDLDIEMLKLIGTRLNKGSCICLSGDLYQTENKYKSNNGLKEFINKFKGNPLVGIVKLKEDVRSDASKLFNCL